MKQLRIMDYYSHQGNQVELFKTGHTFCLSGLNGRPADWNEKHRPLGKNVILAEESKMNRMKFDVIMIRSSLNQKRYMPFLRNGAKGVAVVQTTTPFPIHPVVKHVVWNSADVMKRHSGFYKGKKHYYIPHGFDPDEFKNLEIERNDKILTVANVFKSRAQFTGYALWEWMKDNTDDICDVVGHGNEDMKMGVRCADTFNELVHIYNSYGVYFNPTNSSAMPRARAEAAMCGMPIVSTDNFDIGSYFKNGQDGIITNDRDELLRGVKELLESEQMRQDFSGRAREIAIKHFHIKDHIDRWNYLFGSI